MEQSPLGLLRLSSLEHRDNERRRTAHLPGTVRAASRRTFPVAQYELLLWASPFVVLPGSMARRAETMRLAPLTAIRRILAGFRLWRERARARQELCELSDRMLKDIGLRREDVGYGFPTRVWHCD
jgi:uncharacterized protein YjiS (DUF1127 family)